MQPEAPTIASGLQAVAVVLSGGDPISYLHISLQNGVTLLYGANGAGKTTILDGIDAAFNGIARRSGEARLVCRPSVNRSGWDDQLITDLVHLAASGGDASLITPKDALDLAGWDDCSTEITTDWLQNALAAAVAGRTDTADTRFDVTLVAVGTITDPAWDVYVSSYLDFAPSPTPFPPGLGIPAEVRQGLDVHTQDVFELVGANQHVGSVRHRRIGRLNAANRLRAARAGEDFDIETATLSFIRARYRLAPIEPWDAAEEIGREIGDTATAFFLGMTGMHNQLRYAINDPTDWIEDGPGRWELLEAPTTWVPVARLGSGLRRWAVLAARFSLTDIHSPAVVLVDEPEAGLHPIAVRSVVSALDASGDARYFELPNGVTEQIVSSVIATTHHPLVLSTRDARLVHVQRDANGHTELVPLDSSIDSSQLVEALGWTMPDILLMTRTFVLVEGEHDKAVIEAVFREELAARRAVVVVMGGASNVGHHINAEFLTRFTTARIVVVLDRLGRVASELWDQAQAASAAGDINAALRHLDAIARRDGREADWLGDAGRTALLAGHIDRISVVGLERADIIEYLPVEEFVASARSWKAIGPPPKGQNFKDWLRTHHGAVISTERLRSLASELDSLGDLPSILACIDGPSSLPLARR